MRSDAGSAVISRRSDGARATTRRSVAIRVPAVPRLTGLISGVKAVGRWWFRGWANFVHAIGGPPNYLAGPSPWLTELPRSTEGMDGSPLSGRGVAPRWEAESTVREDTAGPALRERRAPPRRGRAGFTGRLWVGPRLQAYDDAIDPDRKWIR